MASDITAKLHSRELWRWSSDPESEAHNILYQMLPASKKYFWQCTYNFPYIFPAINGRTALACIDHNNVGLLSSRPQRRRKKIQCGVSEIQERVGTEAHLWKQRLWKNIAISLRFQNHQNLMWFSELEKRSHFNLKWLLRLIVKC